MFKVATLNTLKRRTWHGCPLNRAGSELGACIVNERDAMQTLRLPRHTVRRFLLAWDYMQGTDEQCTDRLVEAILTVGLFTEPTGRWRGRRHPSVAATASQRETVATVIGSHATGTPTEAPVTPPTPVED